MDRPDLTALQRAALHAVFAPLADRFDEVAVYGSRATGRARPGSDVDLVIRGARGTALMGKLIGLLEDSDLSIFADVLDYETIRNDRLRAEIDRDAIVLFRSSDLRNESKCA